MVIPTRYRERLAERGDARLVVTIDRDQCLLIYPLNDWEEIERKLMGLPTFNLPAMQQDSVRILPTRTLFAFSQDDVRPPASRLASAGLLR